MTSLASNRAIRAIRMLRGLAIALALAGIPSHAGASTAYSWASAVSGYADETAKWNPNGLPGAADFLGFDVGGAYQVVFPADVSQTASQTFGSGNVTISMSSPHTTGSMYIGKFGSTTSVTLDQGSMAAPTSNGIYLQLGANSSTSTFTVTGYPVSFTGAGYVGYGNGAATLNVTGGAQFYTGPTNLSVGGNYQGSGTLIVAGSNLMTHIRSAVHTGTDNAFPFSVGSSGTGLVNVYNSGFIEVGTDTYVGAGVTGTGTVNIGPGNFLGNSWMNVHGNLHIGDNATGSNIGGHGELTVANRASVDVDGYCQLGDVDSDYGHVLHVLPGSLFFTNGGFKVLAQTLLGSVSPLDFSGGILHVHGGSFSWPSGNLLTISSQVGTPELWITDGAANTGPSTGGLTNQLMIGRGGTGTLRITQPGTTFSTGAGVTTLGDSTGGVGRVVADSSGSFSTGAYIIIGNHGSGEFDVLNGAHATCGATYLSQQPAVAGAGVGTLIVKGAGSSYTARDLFVVGGGNGSSGGPATATIDSGGTVTVITSGAINPPQSTVYSGGTMTAGNAALFTTPGTLGNSGGMVLQNGEIDALSFSSSGSLGGFGRMVTNFQSSGLVDPYSATDPFGAIGITGSFQQTGSGHYQVYLGSSGGRRCDTLLVSGAATLAGALDLKLDWSYVHTPGDTFTVLECGSRSGTFSPVTWNGSALAGQAQIVYGPTSVRVVITSSTADVGTAGGAPALRFASVGSPSAPAFALDLPSDAAVDVRLYDVTGREAGAIFAGPLAAGRHRFDLEAAGRRFTSGAYYARARVRAGSSTLERTARTILVR
jgi:hypothetical protein